MLPSGAACVSNTSGQDGTPRAGRVPEKAPGRRGRLDEPARSDVASGIIEHEEVAMYVRAVRFTDVSAERMQQLLARIKDAGGPPPGVPSTGLKILFDESQGTAVALQQFATAEDMDAGAKVFAAMDPSETPGTRASVDACELKLELES
jgi:hypothetical protein